MEGRGDGRIEIRVTRENEYVHAAIADNGSGIPEEVLPRIFDPFYTTKDPSQGVGIGLTTCYESVKNHKGKIEVHSEPGRTTFDVYLPVGGPK